MSAGKGPPSSSRPAPQPRVEADPGAPLALAVDSSGPVESLALVQGPLLLATSTLRRTRRGSSSLAAQISRLLDDAERRPEQLACIAVARGPGAFTGLRVGMATVQGMVRALDIPLYAFSSTLGWALAAPPMVERPICVALDARRGEVYSCSYGVGEGLLSERSPLQLLTAEVWVESLAELAPEGGVLLGDGAVLYRKEVESRYGSGAYGWPPGGGGPALAGLACDFAARAARGERQEPAEQAPIYLREHDGTRRRSS